MKKESLVYLSVAIWILVFAQSFWISGDVEGPRNIESGFRRLDVFFRFQLMAFMLAIVAAFLGFVYSEKRWRLRLVGLAPLAVTLMFALTILVVTLLPESSVQPPVTNPGPATATN